MRWFAGVHHTGLQGQRLFKSLRLQGCKTVMRATASRFLACQGQCSAEVVVASRLEHCRLAVLQSQGCRSFKVAAASRMHSRESTSLFQGSGGPKLQ